MADREEGKRRRRRPEEGREQDRREDESHRYDPYGRQKGRDAGPPYNFNRNRYGGEGDYYRERGGEYDLQDDYRSPNNRGEDEMNPPGFGRRGRYGEAWRGYDEQGRYKAASQPPPRPDADDEYTKKWGLDKSRYDEVNLESGEPQRYRPDEDRSNRSAPGSMRGRGPRGYRRSDNTIYEDVCQRLTQHGGIDARDIRVEVENGEVTLSGTVDSRRAKRMADDLAGSIPGVMDVHNRLKLSPRDDSRKYGRSDTIRQDIRQGMDVVGLDGKLIGTVKQIRQSDILVERKRQQDLYIPVDAVRRARDQVVLNVETDEIEEQGWRTAGHFNFSAQDED